MVIDTTGTNTSADCLNADYIHLEVPAIGAPIACGLLGVAPTARPVANVGLMALWLLLVLAEVFLAGRDSLF